MKRKNVLIIVAVVIIFIIVGYLLLIRGEKGKAGTLRIGSNSKILIVYYSYSGTTKRVAEHLQKLTKGDLYDIQPETKYSEDSNVTTARLMAERASNKLPKLKGDLPDLKKYQTIIIGTPVWNSDIANPVMTYLQENDFKNKNIAPFWTYINEDGTTYESYKKLSKNGNVLKGLPISSANGYSDKNLDKLLNEWLKK